MNALVRTDCYAGTDITPQDGDIVEWISNGERWTVCREDDLEGPSALHHWPDGGWCGVRLIHRPNAPRERTAVAGTLDGVVGGSGLEVGHV